MFTNIQHGQQVQNLHHHSYQPPIVLLPAKRCKNTHNLLEINKYNWCVHSYICMISRCWLCSLGTVCFSNNYVSTISGAHAHTNTQTDGKTHGLLLLLLLTTATVRRSGVSSLLPPNEDIPLSFSMNSMSGSESIKSSILTSLSVSTFAALY